MMEPIDQESGKNGIAPGPEGRWASFVWARARIWGAANSFFNSGEDADDQMLSLFDEAAYIAAIELDRLCAFYGLQPEGPALRACFRKLVGTCCQTTLERSADLLQSCPDPTKAAGSLAQLAQSAVKVERLVAAGDNQMAEWTILLQTNMYSLELEEEPNLPHAPNSAYRDLADAAREFVLALASCDVQIARALAADFCR